MSERRTYARREGDTKACLGCGKEITRPLHWSHSVWNRRIRFCSISCAKSHTQISDLRERFESHIDRSAPRGCWEWTGLINAADTIAKHEASYVARQEAAQKARAARAKKEAAA